MVHGVGLEPKIHPTISSTLCLKPTPQRWPARQIQIAQLSSGMIVGSQGPCPFTNWRDCAAGISLNSCPGALKDAAICAAEFSAHRLRRRGGKSAILERLIIAFVLPPVGKRGDREPQAPIGRPLGTFGDDRFQKNTLTTGVSVDVLGGAKSDFLSVRV